MIKRLQEITDKLEVKKSISDILQLIADGLEKSYSNDSLLEARTELLGNRIKDLQEKLTSTTLETKEADEKVLQVISRLEQQEKASGLVLGGSIKSVDKKVAEIDKRVEKTENRVEITDKSLGNLEEVVSGISESIEILIKNIDEVEKIAKSKPTIIKGINGSMFLGSYKDVSSLPKGANIGDYAYVESLGQIWYNG